MRVQARGIDKAIARIDAIRARVTNLQPAMQVVGEMIVAETKLSFREEASPDGTAWVELSDFTILRRITRTNKTVKRLQRFGPAVDVPVYDRRRAETRSGRATKRAVKAFLSPGAVRKEFDRGHLFRSISAQASARSVLFGAATVYARAQQAGNPNNKLFGKVPAPIPARPFFPIVSSGRGKSVLMTTGRGGAMWARARELIRIYILTGRISRG